MENKDLEAEIHPLKNEECNAPESQANCAEKEAGPLRKAGRLSRWRTAAFFLSLFLCLMVVFAFSFIIPCPVRPVSQRTWHRTHDNAAAYAFLAVGDVDKDRVQDVLFAFKAAAAGGLNSSSANSSCSSAGFASPCAFVAAHSGTNGSTLWQRPVAEDLLLMDCSAEHEHSPACLIAGKPDLLAALDLETGRTLWQEAAHFGANATVLSPLLKVPDISGDGVPDLLLFAAVGEEEIQSAFHSGSDGTKIGSHGRLRLPGRVGHLLHVTPDEAHYVLFYTADALYAYSLAFFYRMALSAGDQQRPSLKKDLHWEQIIDGLTHQVPLLSSGEIQYLTKVPVNSGTNLLIARSSALQLVEEQRLGSMWVTDIPHLLSEPVLGAYDTDAVDVVVESRVSPQKKKVMIVESVSGGLEWEVELLSGPGAPRPATLATADHRSAFLFWGVHQGDTNGTGSGQGAPQQQQQLYLYLFHPSLPSVLLEMSNTTEPIVAFEGVLFERSRHACYVLLTGPRVGSAPGPVVLSKRKLKEDVAGSRVVWLSALAQDTEQSVRDRLLRMRYRSLR